MPKLRFPLKTKKKRYLGEYREIDRQVLQWQKMRKEHNREVDNPLADQRRLKRDRLKRLKQSITHEDASTTDFFGDMATTPLSDDQEALIARFPAFNKKLK